MWLGDRLQINTVHKAIAQLIKNNHQLFWLPISGIQSLNKNTILLGQDGWADGRLGDYANSGVSLNDSRMIMDLFQAKMLSKFKLLEKMQELADIDAKNLQRDLLLAIKQNPKKIIILTHIPPFKEACMHEGKISDDEWMPYFTSKATGDVLMQIATDNPSIEFVVLCGHTHSDAHYQTLNNLTIKAGHAEYGYPDIQEFVWI